MNTFKVGDKVISKINSTPLLKLNTIYEITKVDQTYRRVFVDVELAKGNSLNLSYPSDWFELANPVIKLTPDGMFSVGTKINLTGNRTGVITEVDSKCRFGLPYLVDFNDGSRSYEEWCSIDEVMTAKPESSTTEIIPVMSEAELFGPMPSKVDEVHEVINFLYGSTDGATKAVRFEMTNDQIQLDNIADQFCLFLRSSGFTYVTEVAIIAGDTEFSSGEYGTE